MKNKYQRVIYELLHDRPVAYSPKLSYVLGSVKASVLMSQLLYWSDKGMRRDGYIFKTIVEIEDETALSRHEQDSAIKRCKKLDVLDVVLKGIPAKRHFKIDVEKLIDLISDWSETGNHSTHISALSIAAARQCITDKTQETTQSKNSTIKTRRQKEDMRNEVMRSRQALLNKM